jgi:hypothetical protein
MQVVKISLEAKVEMLFGYYLKMLWVILDVVDVGNTDAYVSLFQQSGNTVYYVGSQFCLLYTFSILYHILCDLLTSCWIDK